jgi:hypothetical protein
MGPAGWHPEIKTNANAIGSSAILRDAPITP